jgi:hypothetical protein
VYNYYYASPSAIIYSLTQDTTGCYECEGSENSYYNHNICSCECAFNYDCAATLPAEVEKRWVEYPSCSCKCARLAKCSAEYYWNSRSCSCECKRKACCAAGYYPTERGCGCTRCILNANSCSGNTVLDPVTCQCKAKCLPFAACTNGKEWNYLSCNCECPAATCNNRQRWNPSTCKCDCMVLPMCAMGYTFDASTCGCSPVLRLTSVNSTISVTATP